MKNFISFFFIIALLVGSYTTPVKTKTPYLAGGLVLSAGLGIATLKAYSTMKKAERKYFKDDSDENRDRLDAAKKTFNHRRIATLIAALCTGAIGIRENQKDSDIKNSSHTSTTQALDTIEHDRYVAQEEARQKEPVFVAVKLGEADLLDQVISSGAVNLDQKYWGTYTLLDYAIGAIREDLRAGIPISPEKLKIFDTLIAHGVRLEHDHELFQLVGLNQTKLVEKLLDMPNGIDINTRNKHGETLLYQAAYCGATEMVHMLLKRGAYTHLGRQNGVFDYELLPLEAVRERQRYYRDRCADLDDSPEAEKIANYEAIAGLLKTYSN